MTRASFAARRPAKSAHAARADWVQALSLTLTVCADARRAAEGADEATLHQPGATLARLMVALRDLTPENFPVEVYTLRTMAGAYLHLARAFVDPRVGSEGRTACAAFLAAGAEALDWALAELRSREASAWRGQTGERDG